jgi:DNA recombination protein RmuC
MILYILTFLTLIILAITLALLLKSKNPSKVTLAESDKLELLQSIQLFMIEKNNDNQQKQTKDLNSLKESINESLHTSKIGLMETLSENTEKQNKAFNELKEKLQHNFDNFEKKSSESIEKSLKNSAEQISVKMKELTTLVEDRLEKISVKVEENLNKGFEKTNKTFIDITERLTKIDSAQKKIEALSEDVVSLQDILTDKKTRGIFGEVQLNQILVSIFGENNKKLFSLQQQIGQKGAIVDAILHLPEPLGMLPIDAKFPLENYERMIDSKLELSQRDQAKKDFKINIKHHINDINEKYIIPGETYQAIMFLPAEAIFAEIHAYHSDLVEYARNKNVWIASPSTFMALVTTVQTVIKNIETQKQAKVIQEELQKLSQEFGRYKVRWDKLSTHIDTVAKDVKDINTTTEKISNRFSQIEKVELEAPTEEQTLLN